MTTAALVVTSTVLRFAGQVNGVVGPRATRERTFLFALLTRIRPASMIRQLFLRVPAGESHECKEVGVPVASCSTSSDLSASIGGERKAHPSPTPSVRCPALTGHVPADLVRRQTRHDDPHGGYGPSAGVTFNNRALTRELSLAMATSDRAVGDGLPGVRRSRTIDGVPATEVVNGDTRTFRWQHEGAAYGCSYWSVTAVGLTDREVEMVLESVRESS
jgi:hypothetical protein